MIPFYVLGNGSAHPFKVDFLVVAGGGGGGYQNTGVDTSTTGGGGGAGGYLSGMPGELSGRNSGSLGKLVYYYGEAITVTVGAGGAQNAQGNNSVLGDKTAIGGGAGGLSGAVTRDGGNGGAGAGGGTDGLGGDGTALQGFDGSAGGGGGTNFPRTYLCGGAGGAAEDGTISNGGDGIASIITGTSIYRAGGGGGSTGSNSRSSGGLGGGGRGSSFDFGSGFQTALPGSVNTGGGGGGGNFARIDNLIQNFNEAGPGGSGVVIIRYPSRSKELASIDVGLTYSFSDDGVWKRYVFTAGTGNISF